MTSLGSTPVWEDLGKDGLLPVGHKLNQVELLFAKIEDAQVEAQIAKLNATKVANEAADAKKSAQEEPAIVPAKAECTFDDFQTMDIRTATVLEAERVPKTDKLLKLTIDTGLDTRTIVSGIAEYYTPEEMVGKQICILANLQPRRSRHRVKGMIHTSRKTVNAYRLRRETCEWSLYR